MTEYKIVEQQQKSLFKGNMKAKDLENLLNENAKDGWILDRIVDADTTSKIGLSRDVFLIIFKKEK